MPASLEHDDRSMRSIGKPPGRWPSALCWLFPSLAVSSYRHVNRTTYSPEIVAILLMNR